MGIDVVEIPGKGYRGRGYQTQESHEVCPQCEGWHVEIFTWTGTEAWTRCPDCDFHGPSVGGDNLQPDTYHATEEECRNAIELLFMYAVDAWNQAVKPPPVPPRPKRRRRQ